MSDRSNRLTEKLDEIAEASFSRNSTWSHATRRRMSGRRISVSQCRQLKSRGNGRHKVDYETATLGWYDHPYGLCECRQ